MIDAWRILNVGPPITEPAHERAQCERAATYSHVRKKLFAILFIQTLYLLLTPRRLASFLKGSLLLHPQYSVDTSLLTVVNRLRFDSRGRSSRVSPEISISRTVIVVVCTSVPGATSVSCFISETPVPGIEPETCSQSFSHHTKALALSFSTYSFRWALNHQAAEKHLEKFNWR